MIRYKRTAIWVACVAATLLLRPAQNRADAADDNSVNNVVIVLDASGSMNGQMGRGNKMDAAKSALREVLKQVPGDTHIGLLVFSAKNLTDDWVYPLGPRDDARLMQAIDKPIPNGGTPLGAYIKTGADRLLAKREEQHGYGSYRLLVVTDGEASDKKLVDRFVPQVMARGITTDVIGVGMDKSHSLAKMTHSYRSAADPESLKKAIADVFAEVGGSGSNDAIEAAFDELAPIPFEVASAMLQALAASGNHPIGTNPNQAPPSMNAVTQPQQPSAPLSSAPGASPSRGRSRGFPNIIIMGGFIVVLFFVVMAGVRRRN